MFRKQSQQQGFARIAAQILLILSPACHTKTRISEAFGWDLLFV